MEGGTLYIYPEQYEGQEYHPLLFCTRCSRTAGRAAVGDAAKRARTALGGLHLAARDEQQERPRVASASGEIVGESPSITPTGARRWTGSTPAADVVFNTTVPPGCFPFLEALCESGSPSGAGVSSRRTSAPRTLSPRRRPRTSRGCTAASIQLAARPVRGTPRPLLPDGPPFQRRKRMHGHVPRPPGRPPSRKPARSTRLPSSRRSTTRRSPRARAAAEMVPGQHHAVDEHVHRPGA